MDPLGTAVRLLIPRILLTFALIVVACARSGPPQPPYLAIDTASGTRHVRVEIADTEQGRQRGLMGRTTLDDDAGMLFIWPDDTASSFWMKDTPLPLTIAFISANGEILRAFDMEPCAADPCRTYDPRTTYRMALEVKQGALERLGVRTGDRVRLVR